MSVSLENIASLKSESSYYLSDKGEIKEAGFWTKFKYALNLGHSRERVSNLLNEIKTALLTQSDGYGVAKLDGLIRRTDVSSGIKGSAIKEMVNNFKVVQQSTILTATAKKIAGDLSDQLINALAANEPKLVKSPELKNLFMHAALSFTNNPPTKEQEGERVLDKAKLEEDLLKTFNLLKHDLLDVIKSEALGNPRINFIYAKYLQETLFDRYGVRKDKTVEQLQSPRDAYLEVLKKEISIHKDFEAQYAEILDHCSAELGTDDELDRILLSGANALLQRGDSRPRTLDAVKKKIDGIKKNLSELREFKNSNPAIYKQGLEALIALKGRILPESSIKKCIELSKNLPVNYLTNLNAKSSQLELSVQVAKFSAAFSQLMENSGMAAIIDGEDDRIACRNFAAACILGQLTPPQRNKLMSALSSRNYSKLYTFFVDIGADTHKFKGDPTEVLAANFIMNGHLKTMEILKSRLQSLMGHEVTSIPYYASSLPASSDHPTIIDNFHTQSVEYINENIDKFVEQKIRGTASAQIREIFKQRLYQQRKLTPNGYEIFNAAANYTNMLKDDIGSLLTANMIATMQQYAADKEPVFKQDLGRGLQVELPQGKKLSKDYNTALDELSQLVTKKDDAKFMQLSLEDRKKVMIIVSMLSQSTGNSLGRLMLSNLNRGQKNPVFTYDDTDEQPVNQAQYKISLNQNGAIEIKVEQQTELSEFTVQKKKTHTAPGSYVSNSLTIVFYDQDLEKFAGHDFSVHDVAKINNIVQGHQPVAGNGSQSKLSQITQEVGNGFVLASRFQTDFELQVNESQHG